MPELNGNHAAVYDMYHGTEIADPFHWLEDRSSPETNQWIVSQQRSAEAYFGRIPTYSHIEEELANRLDIETLDEPVCMAGTLFCRRRCRGQERASIYSKESCSLSWKLLVDANRLSPSHSINLYRVSTCASTLAYLKRVGGSDQASVHFVNTATRDAFPSQLERGYPRGLVLCPLQAGFYYCHEKRESEENHKILFRPFSDDGPPELVFECPRSIGSKLILSGSENALAALHVYECDGVRLSDLWVCDKVDTNTWTIAFERLPVTSQPVLAANRLFLLTRLVNPGFVISEHDKQGREIGILAGSENGEVRGVACTDMHLYASIQNGMATEIRYWSFADTSGGTIAADAGEVVRLLPTPTHSEAVFFTRESYLNPPAVFSHSAGLNSTPIFENNAEAIRRDVSEMCYAASDGTCIPVTLIGKPGMPQPRPVICLVYGAFGASLLPQFSVLFNLLMDMGAILAVLHVRGGGERGRAWHDAGKRRNKAVSVSDIIDGIAWLGRQPFAEAGCIALYGASAGGLLVASVAMSIPEQLRAVVSIGPLLDMLRYDKFGLARRWRDEFGTSESREDFEVLLSYSPYQNASPFPKRPAFLFVTGDEDDRCDPAHVRKMAARLMETSCRDQPIVVDYSPVRGHTPGLSFAERVLTLSRRSAFLITELGLDMRKMRCA